MDNKEKIIEIQKYSNLKWSDLAKKLGMKSPQTFIDIRSGKIGISPRLAKSILTAYPEINPMWLNGMSDKMFVNGSPQAHGVSATEIPVINSDMIPRLNTGSIFNGVDAAMIVSNNEMPQYAKGDILLLKRVMSMTHLVPGRNYVVNTRDFSVVRKLESVSSNALTMVSSEKDLPTLEIQVPDITSTYAVVGFFCIDSFAR